MNARSACPTTWRSLRYSAVVFAVSAVILVGTAGTLWAAGRHTNEVAILLATAIACFANYARHCTYHCRLTGPLLLAAAVLLILESRGVSLIPESWLWGITATATVGAFWLEAQHVRRGAALGH